MPDINDQKLQLFQTIAKSQGFSDEEIAPMMEMGRIKLQEEQEEDVYDPNTDVVTQRALYMDKMDTDEPFNLETDEVAQRTIATENRAATAQSLKDTAQLENFKALPSPGKEDFDNLSVGAKSLARAENVTRPQLTKAELKIRREERDQIIGLAQGLKELKADAAELNVGGLIASRVGISPKLGNYTRKRKTVAQFIAKSIEGGRLSDKDREFYQKEIVGIGAIGYQPRIESEFDALIRGLIIQSGFNPQEFGIDANGPTIFPQGTGSSPGSIPQGFGSQTSNRINVKSPTGQTGTIDVSELQDAINAGWERL